MWKVPAVLLLLFNLILIVYAQMERRHRQDVDSLQKTILSYQTCKSDADCEINSVCEGANAINNGLCKCLEGFLIIRSRRTYECVLPAETIGSECSHKEQCEFTLGKHSECDARQQCACTDGSHYVKHQNSCYTTSRLNETCVDHDNCIPSYVDDRVFCTYGKCTCGLKQHPNDAGRCVVVRRLGEECHDDDVCLSMNAVCRVVCVCKVGYVLEEDERFCLPAAINLFDACTQHSQCAEFIRHSECVRGKCQCKSHTHQYGNNCFRPQAIGALCQSKGECVTKLTLENRVDCVNSICTCNAGLSADDCGDISAATSANHVKHFILALICSTIMFIIIN